MLVALASRILRDVFILSFSKVSNFEKVGLEFDYDNRLHYILSTQFSALPICKMITRHVKMGEG